MPDKPKLVYTSVNGGTVHTYPISGGKTTFERYLSCYIGSCRFCNDLEEAKKHLTEVEPKSWARFSKVILLRADTQTTWIIALKVTHVSLLTVLAITRLRMVPYLL